MRFGSPAVCVHFVYGISRPGVSFGASLGVFGGLEGGNCILSPARLPVPPLAPLLDKDLQR